MNFNSQINISEPKEDFTKTAVVRITALWALSESILGGFLHGLHVPFRGLFISSASVLFISLIFYFSKNPSQILRSCLLVILVKFVISPHTPVMAYLAVGYQSIFGYIFFRLIPSFKLAALFLGSTVISAGGIQKIITLTVIFGFDLWRTIDDITNEILTYSGITIIESESVSVSLIIISAYIFIHLIAGITTGAVAGKLPGWVNVSDSEKLINGFGSRDSSFELTDKSKAMKKKSIRNIFPNNILLLFLLILILLLSIIFDESISSSLLSILFMIIRAGIIIFIWFQMINPLINKIILKQLNKSKWKHTKEIEHILMLFPHLKQIVIYCWRMSSDYKNTGVRIKRFLGSTIYLLLVSSSAQTHIQK